MDWGEVGNPEEDLKRAIERMGKMTGAENAKILDEIIIEAEKELKKNFEKD